MLCEQLANRVIGESGSANGAVGGPPAPVPDLNAIAHSG